MNTLTGSPADRGTSNEQTALNQLIERLSKQFPDVPAAHIKRLVDRHHAEFGDRPIRTFVPIFVERTVRAELETARTA